MKNTINIFKNDTDLSRQVYFELERALKRYGYQINDSYEDDALLNICIGGDGSFLRAVHQSDLSSIPFVGVNTGTLGFYQEIKVEDLDHFVRSFHEKNYEIQDIMVLELESFENEDRTFYCINEFVIKKKSNSVIHMDVYINGTFLEAYAGDALLFSTPSGSTAYNLSGGGAIMYQKLDGYQMTPLAPINSRSYRSLTQPLIIASDTETRIVPQENEKEEILIMYDGVEIYMDQVKALKINFKGQHIKRLILDDSNYWENIRDKFL